MKERVDGCFYLINLEMIIKFLINLFKIWVKSFGLRRENELLDMVYSKDVINV